MAVSGRGRSAAPGVKRTTAAQQTQMAGCRPLASELVRLVRLDHRILVFYCDTLIRELDLAKEQKGKDGGTAALENAERFPLSLPAAAAGDQS